MLVERQQLRLRKEVFRIRFLKRACLSEPFSMKVPILPTITLKMLMERNLKLAIVCGMPFCMQMVRGL